MQRNRCTTLLGFPLAMVTAPLSVPCQSYGSMDLAPRELVNTMPSILFVCTGNIFRSMTAEYALKARLAPRSPIRVSSAGTLAMPQEMHPDIRAYLVQRGIDPLQHHQRRVSAELLRATDLAIAMSTDHQSFLFDAFQYRAPLFSDVCHGRSEPLLDVWEAIPTWETDLDAARNYVFHVMEYIWASVPDLLQNLGTYLKTDAVSVS
jgi:protein-tyrosine phosphatase